MRTCTFTGGGLPCSSVPGHGARTQPVAAGLRALTQAPGGGQGCAHPAADRGRPAVLPPQGGGAQVRVRVCMHVHVWLCMWVQEQGGG